MPLKAKNAISKTDVEDALAYMGSNVSAVAKQTNIPRSYLSDLKNRNVRLRREHEDKLRTFLQDQGVELESDTPTDQAKTASPHPAVEVAKVIRRSLTLDDALDDDVIAAALDAQADRDTRLSTLFAMRVEREVGLFDFSGHGDYTNESKRAIGEARSLLAESYMAVGILRGLRGFKAAAPEGEPQSIGEHFSDLFSDLLTKESAESASAEPQAHPEPAPKKSIMDGIL